MQGQRIWNIPGQPRPWVYWTQSTIINLVMYELIAGGICPSLEEVSCISLSWHDWWIWDGAPCLPDERFTTKLPRSRNFHQSRVKSQDEQFYHQERNNIKSPYPGGTKRQNGLRAIYVCDLSIFFLWVPKVRLKETALGHVGNEMKL